MIRLLAFLLCLGTTATAQILPDVFAVSGVPANDTLNIRSGPDAGSDIIDTIKPDATRVEIIALSDDGKWGMIGVPEGNGWVSMRYLAATPTTQDLPTPIACYGTEPFWSLSIDQTSARFDRMGEAAEPMAVAQTASTPNEYFAELHANGAFARLANIRRETCNDGMSDRIFGFKVSLYNSEITGGGAYNGCCTLQTGN